MNYKETLEWMFSQLPMYQNQGATAYRKDLTNTILLVEHLGNPEKNIACIHVAGTNGKGSTSHMIASILQEAGYRVGLYTSPHLKDFRERIKINGEEISENFVTSFIADNRQFFEEHNLSFFEMTVGLAFDYFEKNKVDIAVIEVGMGGRLDSTNIINPLVSVITNIGFDHMQFLGNTLPLIAAEKAGIIKPETPVVIGQYSAETKAVFEKIAAENNARLFFASDIERPYFETPLKGNYQIHNIKTVLMTIQVLQEIGALSINDNDISQGLLNVIKNTGLQGRWQQLQKKPIIICDTAHNFDGLQLVIEQVKAHQYEQLHVVLGLVNDKNLDDILPLFPKSARYYFCKPNISRGLEARVLMEKAKHFDLVGSTYESVYSAYEAAKNSATAEDFIFVGGSTFVIAEII